MTAERRAAIEACMRDGWPLIQIERTHGVAWKTLRRHWPDYRGMDRREAAALGAVGRRASLALKKT